MQNPEGQVVSVNIDGDQISATVAVDAAVFCPRCAEGKGCGAGILGTAAGEGRVEARVLDDLDIEIGDRVNLVLEPRRVLQAAAIVYGLPLAGALLGAIAAWALRVGDAVASLSALIGLLAGFFLARWRVSASGCVQDYTPKIVDRIGSMAD